MTVGGDPAGGGGGGGGGRRPRRAGAVRRWGRRRRRRRRRRGRPRDVDGKSHVAGVVVGDADVHPVENRRRRVGIFVET